MDNSCNALTRNDKNSDSTLSGIFFRVLQSLTKIEGELGELQVSDSLPKSLSVFTPSKCANNVAEILTGSVNPNSPINKLAAAYHHLSDVREGFYSLSRRTAALSLPQVELCVDGLSDLLSDITSIVISVPARSLCEISAKARMLEDCVDKSDANYMERLMLSVCCDIQALAKANSAVAGIPKDAEILIK